MQLQVTEPSLRNVAMELGVSRSQWRGIYEHLCNLAVSQPLVGRSLTAIRDEFAQLPVITMTGWLPVSCHC